MPWIDVHAMFLHRLRDLIDNAIPCAFNS
jgi:hypothetical protein